MGTVKVYQYRRPYDMMTDEDGISRRMGTRAYIELVKGTIIEGTELEVDETDVTGDGMTEIGFADRLNKRVKPI
jgi:hypothetical protein